MSVSPLFPDEMTVNMMIIHMQLIMTTVRISYGIDLSPDLVKWQPHAHKE